MDYIIEHLSRVKLALMMGKGGVGKTSMSAGLAELAAESGIKTLVITVDPAGRLNDWYSQKLGHDPTVINQNLDAIMIDHKLALDELVGSYTKDPRKLEEIRQSPLYDIVGRGLPGLPESMAVWKIKQLLDRSEKGELPYRLIVVDLPPKGQGEHFLNLSDTIQRALDTVSISQLHMQLYDFTKMVGSAARNIVNTISGKKHEEPFYLTNFIKEIRRVTTEVEKAFKDPAVTIFNIVLHAEKPVITESLELLKSVRALGIPIGFFVWNRVEAGLGPEARAELAELEAKGGLGKLMRKAESARGEKLVEAMLGQARYRELLHREQIDRIKTARKNVAGVPFFMVPEFPQSDDLPSNRPAFKKYLAERRLPL
ncbi:MAG: ArsA family ATPase [Spirochaetales bacterium]|nr:ArsA family ATPase [Spirochaetales bacterium]